MHKLQAIAQRLHSQRQERNATMTWVIILNVMTLIVILMATLSENGIPVCCNAAACKLPLMSMHSTMATAKTR
eukprot:6417345-Amphidinium_carterae.1